MSIAPQQAIQFAKDAAAARLLGTSGHWYREALTVDPSGLQNSSWATTPDEYLCLGTSAYEIGKYEEAINFYDKAIVGNCVDPEFARWNKAIALHSIGQYREGWCAHQARGEQKTLPELAKPMHRFKAPLWLWESAPAHIHVHQEQGLGDTIALTRYIPLLVERGYKVTLEVHSSLVELLQYNFPQVKVVPKARDYPGVEGIDLDFDYHLPMLSFPYLWGTDTTTVPWRGPYLKAHPALVGKYRPYVPKGAIGLCWSSGVRQGAWMTEYGMRKSCGIEVLKSLMGSGHSFVSLQTGLERAGMHDYLDILDLLPETPTFADTAALVECLDLVISVDTSVAHLAGALGKPLWLMMHCGGSWHWMTKRLDSPWYPSARLFRQEKPYRWEEVVRQIAVALPSTVSI